MPIASRSARYWSWTASAPCSAAFIPVRVWVSLSAVKLAVQVQLGINQIMVENPRRFFEGSS